MDVKQGYLLSPILFGQLIAIKGLLVGYDIQQGVWGGICNVWSMAEKLLTTPISAYWVVNTALFGAENDSVTVQKS
jgi:hypothetical protein